MKTSISVPDSLISELLELSAARSRNEAIQEAISAYVATLHRQKALATLGTFEDFMNPGDLAAMRKGS